jgi:hypothetical protein
MRFLGRKLWRSNFRQETPWEQWEQIVVADRDETILAETIRRRVVRVSPVTAAITSANFLGAAIIRNALGRSYGGARVDTAVRLMLGRCVGRWVYVQEPTAQELRNGRRSGDRRAFCLIRHRADGTLLAVKNCQPSVWWWYDLALHPEGTLSEALERAKATSEGLSTAHWIREVPGLSEEAERDACRVLRDVGERLCRVGICTVPEVSDGCCETCGGGVVTTRFSSTETYIGCACTSHEDFPRWLLEAWDDVCVILRRPVELAS